MSKKSQISDSELEGVVGGVGQAASEGEANLTPEEKGEVNAEVSTTIKTEDK